MSDLPTAVHTRAMQAIADLKRELRKQPSLGQIAVRLDVSPQYVDMMLKLLGERGYTERRGDGQQMRWHLTDLGTRWLKKTREFVTDDPPKRK